jgi:TonB-dependent SusC/RagA subfamily outer membrane receptor
MVVPFLNIPVYFSSTAVELQSIDSFSIYLNSAGNGEGEVAKESMNWYSMGNLFFVLYILLGIIFLGRALYSVFSITRMIRSYPSEKIGKVNFLNTSEPGTPFSFFNWLFWDRKLSVNSEKGKQVFRHEMYHINQRHSLDIILMEIVTIIMWINPFFHLIKKELKAIHEFLADSHVLESEEKWTYAETLLMQVLGTRHSIVNPFFNNQIKRRIAMITNPQKTSHRYLRQLLVLPVIASITLLFAFSYRNDEIKNDESAKKMDFKQTENFQDTGKPRMDSVFVNVKSFRRGSPTREQMDNWTDAKVYGVWLDGRRINNSELAKMKPSSIVFFTETKLKNNSPDYGKFYFHVNLMRNDYYRANIPKEKLTKSEKPNITALTKLEGDPLIVIDGVIQKDKSMGVLNDLNGNDIESITILKDASATSLYGEDGANGVIQILTKNESNNNGDEIQAEGPVFSKVEIEPSFPGGVSAWSKFLASNMNSKVVSAAPPGKYSVYVMFTVGLDGEISDLKAITNHGHGLEEEALRIMKKSPRWEPGIQNGRKVKAVRKQVITFE